MCKFSLKKCTDALPGYYHSSIQTRIESNENTRTINSIQYSENWYSVLTPSNSSKYEQNIIKSSFESESSFQHKNARIVSNKNCNKKAYNIPKNYQQSNYQTYHHVEKPSMMCTN